MAQRLAREANAVAGALARGDTCAATRLGRRLRVDATSSISRIPVRFQEPLSSGVNALLAELPVCRAVSRPVTTAQATTAQPTPPPTSHAEGKHEHEKHAEHHKRPKPKHGKKKDEK